MKFFVNGSEGNALIHVRGADTVYNILFLNDDGTPLSLASPAVAEVEFFTTEERTDTPSPVLTVTPGAGAAAGFGTLVIQDSNLLLERGTVYAWGRYKSGAGTGVGTLVSIGITPSEIKVI